MTDSELFHWLTNTFSAFPHGTCSLSLNLLYLALEDGSPLFKQVNTHSTFLTIIINIL